MSNERRRPRIGGETVGRLAAMAEQTTSVERAEDMAEQGRAGPPRRGDPAAARPADRQGRRAGRRARAGSPSSRQRAPASAQPRGNRSRRSPARSRSAGGRLRSSAAAGLGSGGAAAVLDPHAGLRDAGRRARGDAGLGPRAELRRLGAVPGRRLLDRSRTCGEILDRPRSADPRIRVTARAEQRRHRRRLQRRPGDGAGRVRRPARPRRRAAPRRPRGGRRGDRRRPRGRLRLHRRGQDRRAGRHSGPFFKPDWSPERMRTQMYTCHLSVLRRSLVEEVGGFDPEFEGSQDWDLVLKVTERARAVAARAEGPLPLADAARPRPPAAARRRSRGPSKPASARCRRTASGSGCRRGSSATPTDPGVYHLEPELRERAAGQHRHPDRGDRARGALRAGRPGRALRAQHRRDLHLRELRDRRRRRRRGRRRAMLAGAAARSPASGCASSAYERPFNFSAKINRGAVHSRGRAPAAAQRRHRGRHPGLDRAHGHVLGDGGGRRGRRPPAPARTAASSTPGSSFENGLPGHPYHGFAGDFRGYSNNVRIARELPRRDRRLPDDPPRRSSRSSAASPPRCRSTTTTSTTASRRGRAAGGSSTTPTPSSTTSSPPAAPPRSRTGRRNGYRTAGCR